MGGSGSGGISRDTMGETASSVICSHTWGGRAGPGAGRPPLRKILPLRASHGMPSGLAGKAQTTKNDGKRARTVLLEGIHTINILPLPNIIIVLKN